MIFAVADTHAALWYVYDDPRMPAQTKDQIDAAARRGEQIIISSITIAEIVYLIEKGRLRSEALTRLLMLLQSEESMLVEAPVDSTICQALTRVPRAAVPELPDRIVAATALHFGVPVISRDQKIQAANLKTIW